jgi:hypothetical protein
MIFSISNIGKTFGDVAGLPTAQFQSPISWGVQVNVAGNAKVFDNAKVVSIPDFVGCSGQLRPSGHYARSVFGCFNPRFRGVFRSTLK